MLVFIKLVENFFEFIFQKSKNPKIIRNEIDNPPKGNNELIDWEFRILEPRKGFSCPLKNGKLFPVKFQTLLSQFPLNG